MTFTKDEAAYCSIHGAFYSGWAKCPTCERMEREDREEPAEAKEGQ